MYNFRTIPAKLFFEIEQTEDISLLKTKKSKDVDLSNSWNAIKSKFDKLNKGSEKLQKALSIECRVRSLETRYNAVQLIISTIELYGLDDAKKYLSDDLGYVLRDDYFTGDLNKIKKRVNNLKIKIAKYNEQLADLNIKEAKHDELAFERNLMVMAVVLEKGYINSNEILLCDYLVMCDLTEEKIKALESNKPVA